MYKEPIFLNSETHRELKIAPVGDYNFASELNSVVLVGQEFLESAKFYPVVFTKAEEEQIVPVAILGLRNSQNLYVDENGKWEEGTYIPAFFRRYPFILAENVGKDGAFAVCVDSAYEGYDAEEGTGLFNEEGEQTEEFKRIIQFLTNYQNQHRRTRELINLLEEYELFKDVSANITMPGGERIGFGKLLMVDEEAMLKLDDEKVLKLVRSGFLAWIYAHLYSLSNFRSLMAHDGQSGGTPETPAEEESAAG